MKQIIALSHNRVDCRTTDQFAYPALGRLLINPKYVTPGLLSASTPKADICQTDRHVRFGPTAVRRINGPFLLADPSFVSQSDRWPKAASERAINIVKLFAVKVRLLSPSLEPVRLSSAN